MINQLKRAAIASARAVGIDLRRYVGVALSDAELQALLAPLDPRFRAPLLSLYAGNDQPGSDGALHPIDRKTRISPEQGMWLHDFCVAQKPAQVVEIGMAYGYSSLYFLAALDRNGRGRLTSIDPFQDANWGGIGRTHAQAVAPARDGGAFRFIQDRGDRAQADLARAGERFELVFIDGNHRFDDVLTDFYLYAPLCTVGGHLVFDDYWMRSIRAVVAYVRNNRADMVEVPTGLANIVVFRKVAEDTRDWQHFRPFAT